MLRVHQSLRLHLTEELNVTTLGGVETDLTVTNYQCSIRDVDGNMEFFEAYGMETITGHLSTLSLSSIKTLFPHLSHKSVQGLLRSGEVDILIGIAHPSWHPDRAEMAQGGGDMWMYRGKFGSCFGGRHPLVKESMKKSDTLFTVNHHIVCAPCSSELEIASHELQYCQDRVQLYHISKNPSSVHVYDPACSNVSANHSRLPLLMTFQTLASFLTSACEMFLTSASERFQTIASFLISAFEMFLTSASEKVLTIALFQTRAFMLTSLALVMFLITRWEQASNLQEEAWRVEVT